jgi:Zn-dependent metalloprotease
MTTVNASSSTLGAAMNGILRQPLAAIALVCTLALGGMGTVFATQASPRLSPQQFAALRAEQPARAQRALESVLSRRAELGVDERGGFAIRTAFTNAQGQLVARLPQTFSGHRVWGGEAIVRVLPSGEIQTQTAAVRGGIALEGQPSVTSGQAMAIALKSFAARGPLAGPARVERVVFPTEFTGGLALSREAKTGQTRVNRAASVFARRPAAPFIWAWEVKAATFNRQDGPREMSFIVDGASGAILRKANELKAIDVLPPLTATPSTGTGTGLYARSVTLDTSLDSTGLSWLWDQTRGSMPNPYLGSQASSGSYTGPTTGLMVWYEDHPSFDNVVYNNATGSFGDGQRYQGTSNEAMANGETAGVDAQFAMSKSWDFFQQILFVNGFDFNGTSPLVQVHVMSPGINDGPVVPYDGAYWSDYLFGPILGDGTYPLDPNGTLPYTEVDVVAHELVHGLINKTAGLYGNTESVALSEGASDALGEAVEAFAYGTPRSDAYGTPLIPDDGNDWGVGTRMHQGTPLRYFAKPSQDGLSMDSWFEGLDQLDEHYSNGPLNRAFYFLVKGASSNPTDANYSPYLPGGMTGIGMDAAARIWFKMVTEYLGPYSTYPDARVAAISAARDLRYSSDSVEETAVENAFAAINVGDAPGMATRTHVSFPTLHDHGRLYENPNFRRMPLVGRGTVVALHADVTNNQDTRIQWKLGTPFTAGSRIIPAGGYIDAEERWHTPMRMDWHGVTAVSVADPLQYAVSGVYLFNMDNDDDGESDAVDMGGIALSWFLGFNIADANSVFYAPFVDDDDIAIFHEGMKNAYSVPAPAAVRP